MTKKKTDINLISIIGACRSLGAAAYFEQKAEMCRSLIPQVIESVLARGEGE